VIAFTVPGRAATQGSHRVRHVRRGPRRGQAVVVPDHPALYSYRAAVAAIAARALRGAGKKRLDAGPVKLRLAFVLERPKSVRGRALPCVRPDLDKLARAVLDALSGVLYRDDGQVVELRLEKLYGEPETRVELESFAC